MDASALLDLSADQLQLPAIAPRDLVTDAQLRTCQCVIDNYSHLAAYGTALHRRIEMPDCELLDSMSSEQLTYATHRAQAVGETPARFLRGVYSDLYGNARILRPGWRQGRTEGLPVSSGRLGRTRRGRRSTSCHAQPDQRSWLLVFFYAILSWCTLLVAFISALPRQSSGVNLRPTILCVLRQWYSLFDTPARTHQGHAPTEMARQGEQQWSFLGAMFSHTCQKVTGLRCGEIVVGDRVVVKRPTGVYTGAIVCEVNAQGHPTLIVDKSQTKKGPFEYPELSCFPLEAMTPWSNFKTPDTRKHCTVPPDAPRKPRGVGAARLAVRCRPIRRPPPVRRHAQSTQIPGMAKCGTWTSTSEVQGHGVDEPEALERAIANSLRDRVYKSNALEQAIANSLGDVPTPPSQSAAVEVIDLTD